MESCSSLCKKSKRSAILNSTRGAWKTEEDDSTLSHKRGSGSVRPETAAETAEAHTHTEGLEYRKVNREARKKMEAAKKGWVEEQCKNIDKRNDVRKQEICLQHPPGCRQDPTT